MTSIWSCRVPRYMLWSSTYLFSVIWVSFCGPVAIVFGSVGCHFPVITESHPGHPSGFFKSAEGHVIVI